MWFKLEATSCMDSTDVLKKYCKELSTFNVRMLNVPRLYFSDSLTMDVSVLVELKTLEDFIRLRDSLDRPLILHQEDILIEIYDDWKE